MKKNGTKIAVVAMAIIILVIAVILFVVKNATNTLVEGMLTEQSKNANNAFASTLEEYEDVALERAEMIAGSAEVVNAVLNNDHDALLNALNNFSVGLDLITLCDADGVVLARTHNDKTGDSVMSQKAITTALSTGKGIKTIEPGTVIGLSTRGSAAIKDPNGNIIGALTCGHDLSQTKYVDDIKNKYGCEVTFFAGDTRMNTTLLNESGERAVGTQAGEDVIQKVLNNGEVYYGRVTLYGSTYDTCYSPVVVDNETVGMLLTAISADAVLSQEQDMVVMIVISMVMLVCALAITLIVIRWTTKKSYWYESILDSIPFPLSITDMNMNWTFINKPVEDMLGKKRANLLGKPCSNWGAAICNTGNCGITCLKAGKQSTTFAQAGMDFQVNTSYLKDSRGHDVGHIEVVQDISESVKLQKAQSKLIDNINEVSGTFIAGSKQIADGAQSLAQGSTQQAAAVEELLSSIHQISLTTRDNAKMADNAARLADTIKDNAEKGSTQMDQMMQAVREINDASQNINKVIKVIDDIAFQTNILALNAAVEAARAGQHGKGFAVVAEEVRSLAAKSAEAAKDTGTLIANSIEKAELGSQIAGETASSLDEIVTGINESSQIVGEIARSSGEQSVSLEQINKGIEQVSQVVQQNSATAEQSAAASQELSAQAGILGDLISDFEREAATGSEDALEPGGRNALPSRRS